MSDFEQYKTPGTRMTAGDTTFIRVLNGWVKLGDNIAWPGHDSYNKTTGIRKGVVREIRDNGSLLVHVSASSSGINSPTHVIQNDQLRKVVM